MGVKIISQNIYPELSTQATNFLLGNSFKKLRIETVVEHSIFAMSDSQSPMILNNTDGYIGTGWITDPRNQFADIKVGDTLIFNDYQGLNTFSNNPYTVLQKLSDGEIQVNVFITGTNPITNDQAYDTIVISVSTPITALTYKWNFIENAEAVNYFSKIDGSEQVLVAPLIDASDTTTIIPMSFLGTPLQTPYQIGRAIIVGNGITSANIYKSQFKIIHYTFLTPFFLSDQWTDLQNGVSPGYYFNLNCLRYVSQFTSMFDYSDPNRVFSVEESTQQGNTGWLNENFNTGLTNYYIQSLVYKDNALNILPAIELSTNDTDFTIILKNTISTPFSNNNTKFVVNFCKAPLDESEYQNNTNNLAQNFLFDRCLQTVGSAAVNGDNYGTAYQVLKNVSATFNSSSQITITGKITMDSSIVSALDLLDDARYIFTIEVQNHTLATLVSDNVNLLIDANDFFIDNTDPSMIIFDSVKYLRHFESDPLTEGSTSCNGFKEDEFTACAKIFVDHTGRTTDVIELIELEMRIKMKNSSTLEEFTLDGTGIINLSNLPYINGDQYINFDLPRNFHVPTAEKIKHIHVQRVPAQDSGLKSAYYLQFPFLIDWAYFQSLIPNAGAFFNTGQPNNGWNHDWFRMAAFTNWLAYYEIRIKAKKNGVPLQYYFEDPLTIFDYEAKPPDYQPVSIKAYDNVTNTLLYDSSSHVDYILGYATTRIEAKFKKVANYPIVLADVVTLLGIEVYEKGGVFGRRRISSKWVLDSDTWFLSSDGSGKIVNSLFTVAHSNDGLLVVALLDYTQLPPEIEFKITARVFDLTAPAATNLITEDGQGISTEDGHDLSIEA